MNYNTINISDNSPNNENYLNQLNQEVTETKNLLLKNCDKIVDRENSINELDSRAAALNLSSITFKHNTNKLKNKMWWKEKRCIFGAIIILIIIIVIIVLSNKS